MDKNKKFTRITLAAVIIAVIGLTVAFAALSKTLTINGAGSLDRANWDIHFKNVQFLSKTPTATTTGTPTPTNNDKGPTIDNINVTLKQPGDYVSYTADIENEGDVDALIYLVTPPTLTARQNQLFEFTAEYTQTQANGTKTIAQGDYLASGSTIYVESQPVLDLLNAGYNCYFKSLTTVVVDPTQFN